MICPECQSTNINKYGHKRGKQNYQCKNCKAQFVEYYSPRGYPESVKRHCLHLYVEGNGLRRISRLTGVSHTTVANWVKEAGLSLPEQPDYEEIPSATQIDELQTYIGKKNKKIWLWTAVKKGLPGIIAWVIGDRSAETFKPLWKIIKGWESFFYATDGYVVYPSFIDDGDHIVSKTYMTRVEGENTRLRHYLARLHRKTLCYSKSREMLKLSVRLVIYYLQDKIVTIPMSIYDRPSKRVLKFIL